MPIIVFGKSACRQCEATTRKLDELGLVYRYVDLEADLDAFCRLQAEGHRQAPVVEVDGDTWSGFRPDLLQKLGGAHVQPR